MTMDFIRSTLCKWICSLGYVAVNSPSNNPAPEGMYLSVSTGPVSQIGDIRKPPPVTGMKKSAWNLLSVTVHEVEGDGDALRAFRNSLQTKEFSDFVRAECGETEGNVDSVFSVGDTGTITDLSVKDGDFWIKQKVFDFEINFYDAFGSAAEKVASVSGTLNGNSFEISGEND